MAALTIRLLALVVVALSISACSGTVQDRFGLTKRAPDEFQVVRRAPLAIPPDFNLRPPGDGSDAPAAATPSEQAREIVTGAPAAVAVGQSPIELALIDLSPVESLPGIRERILEEDSALVQLDEDRFLFILDFQRRGLQGAPVALDPIEETERLQDAGIPTRVTTQRVSTETFVTQPGLLIEESES